MWSAVERGGGGSGGAGPCARGKHSATLLGAHVYVLGGRGAGGALPLRDFWRYSLADGSWERLECRGQPPPALQEHTATAHGSRLYVFGGEAGTLTNETPLWIYDTETGVWRKLPNPQPSAKGPAPARRRGRETRAQAAGAAAPRGRRGHSAHPLKDCLLIYGGYKDLRGSTNELWAFHYESESWQAVRTASAGPARHRHAAVLHDARLYVHAGTQDLRDQPDLWHYDTMSRVWTQVRTPTRTSPGARSGHAGLRAGAHFYIFGGEIGGQPTNELWRFHFATELWERMEIGLQWPSPRVDCRALLVPAAAAARPHSAPAPAAPRAAAAAAAIPRTAPASRPDPPTSLLRTKLSSFNLRRSQRCSYSVLAPDGDSTESLVRDSTISKSHSSYVIDRRQNGGGSPREGDVPENYRDMSREPISVPDFADMVLPTPVLSPVEATKLVYLDSEEEEDIRREMESVKRRETRADITAQKTAVALPKSASVRFTADSVTVTMEDEGELSTSDYASAEKVNRVSLGFSNPHYLGPDVRRLGAALTPDSGVAPGDIELQELGQRAPRRPRPRPERGPHPHLHLHLHLLLVGGREAPHVALYNAPLSMWTYRLL